MRRTAQYAAILSFCLSFVGLSQPLRPLLADTPTPTSAAALQYTKILHIPYVTSIYGIIPVVWTAWNPIGSVFAAVYQYDVYDVPNPIHILDGGSGSSVQELGSMESTGNSTFAWSPDGKRIAAILSGSNNVIKIWALAGKPETSPITIRRIGEPYPYEIFWSPDGLELAETEFVPSPLGESGNIVLFIWDTKTGKLISSHPYMTFGSWSPDGKKMVVLAYRASKSFLQIVDPTTFQLLSTFPALPDDEGIGYVIWVPDNRRMIGANCFSGGNCDLWLWDVQTGRVDKHFEQNNISTSDLSQNTFVLNATGTLLASTFWNAGSTVYLWDVQSGRLLNSLDAHDRIVSLSWNHSQDLLLLGSIDGTIQVWKVQRALGTSAGATEAR